jgi:hypothetical protein
MPWFYVDDSFADSKPVMRLDAALRNEAIGLWVRCGAWSAKEETDGHVPLDVVRSFNGTPRLIRALHNSAELWVESSPESWRNSREIVFGNWEKWQKTRAELLAKRKNDADRQRVHRRKGRNHVTSSNPEMPRRDTPATEDGCHAVTNGVTDENVTRDVTRESSRARPPRPDPTLTGNSPTKGTVALSGGSGGRGARLTPGWTPPADVIAQMRDDHPHVDLKTEHAKFCDYWLAKAGKDATKLDWSATWRNWIRRAAEQQPTHRNGSTTSTPSTRDRKYAATQALKQKYQSDQQKEITE